MSDSTDVKSETIELVELNEPEKQLPAAASKDEPPSSTVPLLDNKPAAPPSITISIWHLLAIAICAFATWAVMNQPQPAFVEGIKLKSFDRARQAEEVMALYPRKHPNERLTPFLVPDFLSGPPGKGVIFGRMKMDDQSFQHFPIGANLGMAWNHGYFMALTDYNKPVEFVVHGYKPVVINLQAMDLKGDLNWIGEYEMPSVDPQTGGTVTAKLIYPPGEHSTPMPVTFTPLATQVVHQQVGWPHRRDLEYNLIAKDGVPFTITKCSPTRYEMWIHSTEFIDVIKEVKVEPGQKLDLGEIPLQSASKLTFEYKTSADPWIYDIPAEKITLRAESPAGYFDNMGTLSELPEHLDLSLDEPLDGKWNLDWFRTVDFEICDLGELKSIPKDFDGTKCKMINGAQQKIKLGHVYATNSGSGGWLLWRLTRQ